MDNGLLFGRALSADVSLCLQWEKRKIDGLPKYPAQCRESGGTRGGFLACGPACG